MLQGLGNFSRTEGKNLATGKEQAAENLITWTTDYMRLYVTEMHINKSIRDWVHQVQTLWKISSSTNKYCQKKNIDPTTCMTIQLSCTKQTFSKLQL